MNLFVSNIVTIISILSATFLMLQDKSGWGWLVFIALCALHVRSSGKEDGDH